MSKRCNYCRDHIDNDVAYYELVQETGCKEYCCLTCAASADIDVAVRWNDGKIK